MFKKRDKIVSRGVFLMTWSGMLAVWWVILRIESCRARAHGIFEGYLTTSSKRRPLMVLSETEERVKDNQLCAT